MNCLHPHCPIGHGAPDWATVVDSAAARIRIGDRPRLLSALLSCGPLGTGIPAIPAGMTTSAPFKRILDLCPCLYAQVPDAVSARGVVHLCEVTLGRMIDSASVYDAFKIQHPGMSAHPFLYPPANSGAGGGDIMEVTSG